MTVAKKADSKTTPSKKPDETKTNKNKWTKEDDAARKIQTIIRGYLGRKALERAKKEKQEYEDLMDKLEREVRK